MEAASRASCSAPLVVVPCSIRSPMTSASETCAADSSTLPARTTSSISTLGSGPYCTSVTAIPLGRVSSRFSGRMNDTGGPAVGGASF